jgi:hypothetical protein
LINNETVDIFVIPAEDREKDEGFDPESISLTWVLHEFDDRDLTYNVTFDQPSAISPLVTQDQIGLNLTKMEIFRSIEWYEQFPDRQRQLEESEESE